MKDLIKQLRNIKENNYMVKSDEEINYLLPKMIDNIGSTDSELRDKLIYTIFFYWIMDRKLTNDQLKELLNISLSDKYLFNKVGSINSDSVFTRSFSVLLIPLILHINLKDNFLSNEIILDVFNKLIDYFKREKDFRGYVKGKGWAHSIAHAADALDEISKNEIINKDRLLIILEAIKDKVHINSYSYINEEDERLAIAVHSIFKRNLLDIKDIYNWIDRLIEYKKSDIYPEDDIILTNVKSFLRSLYFRILTDEKYNVITTYILDSLSKLDNYN